MPDSVASQQVRKRWTRARTVAGIIGTIAWLAIAIWWTFYEPSHYWSIPGLRPNEWGDWDAGTFAPLAFVWLVLGYMQQGEELEQNTEALKRQEQQLQAQVQELKDSSLAQKALVEATRLQALTSAQASRIASAATLTAFQPAFIFREPKSTLSMGVAQLVFANEGREATEVRLTVRKAQINGASIHPPEIELWEPKKDRAFSLKFPPAPQFKCAISIEYIDALGLRQGRTFKLSVKSSPEISLRVTARPFSINTMAHEDVAVPIVAGQSAARDEGLSA